MNIIKLNAIDSTSVFLKNMSKNGGVENYTTVVADVQTNGKGQMNTNWHSADGKNLLFTTYVELKGLPLDLSPFISFLIALKIREVLTSLLKEKGKIQIKWPNDILSYHKKIAGILVENTIKQNTVFASFIGIGLNINELLFPDFLPNAISLSAISGVEHDKEQVLEALLNAFKSVLTIDYIVNNKEAIKQEYLKYLYKINTPTMFKTKQEGVFMAKVINVSDSGLLILEKEDELEYSYALKEISFL